MGKEGNMGMGERNMERGNMMVGKGNIDGDMWVEEEHGDGVDKGGGWETWG